MKKDKVLELEPALGINYLAFSNSIDRALIALGLERRQVDQSFDLGKYVRQHDEAKARGAAGEGGEDE